MSHRVAACLCKTRIFFSPKKKKKKKRESGATGKKKKISHTFQFRRRWRSLSGDAPPRAAARRLVGALFRPRPQEAATPEGGAALAEQLRLGRRRQQQDLRHRQSVGSGNRPLRPRPGQRFGGGAPATANTRRCVLPFGDRRDCAPLVPRDAAGMIDLSSPRGGFEMGETRPERFGADRRR